MDISAIVAQNYAASKTAMAPDQNSGANPLILSAKSFQETLATSEATAMQAMSSGADPHALVQALA